MFVNIQQFIWDENYELGLMGQSWEELTASVVSFQNLKIF